MTRVDERLIPVELDRLVLDESAQSPVLILREREGNRLLPIWIGQSEALSIALVLEGQRPPRPLTHDLMRSLLLGLDTDLSMVVINDLKDNTFYARLVLHRDGDPPRVVSVDARPSDSIALAVRTGTPIYVSQSVMARGGITAEGEEPGASS